MSAALTDEQVRQTGLAALEANLALWTRCAFWPSCAVSRSTISSGVKRRSKVFPLANSSSVSSKRAANNRVRNADVVA